MKLKNIFNSIWIAIIAMQLNSCDHQGEVDAVFDQTPTERLNAKQKELNDALESSEFGWKMVYFTDTTQLGGFTYLFKFKGGVVEMASDFDDDTAIHKSEYSINLGSTTSLVFTTKNKIHLLSDALDAPTLPLTGQGYKGDFQFLFYGKEKDQLIFKTNKKLLEIRLIKAKSEDWPNLSKNRKMLANLSGDTKPLFRSLEIKDGTKKSVFDFIYYKSTRFANSTSIDPGSKSKYKMGIAYTPTGITIRPAIQVGNQKISEFTYDEVTGNFIATGANGVSASIKYSNSPLVLSDYYKILLKGQSRSIFMLASGLGPALETDSPLYLSQLAKVNANLEDGVKIRVIALDFNYQGTLNYIYYVFNNNTVLYHFVDVSEDATKKTLILTNKSWDGTASAKSIEAIKFFDDYLMDKNGLYVIKENYFVSGETSYITFSSASSPFRMTTIKIF